RDRGVNLGLPKTGFGLAVSAKPYFSICVCVCMCVCVCVTVCVCVCVCVRVFFYVSFRLPCLHIPCVLSSILAKSYKRLSSLPICPKCALESSVSVAVTAEG